MKLTGTIIDMTGLEAGQSKNGKDWKKRTVVIETDDDKYPKQIALECWDDVSFKVNMGDKVDVSIELSSREYNGKWYTTAKAWKLEVLGAKKDEPKSEPSEQVPDPDQSNDLPF